MNVEKLKSMADSAEREKWDNVLVVSSEPESWNFGATIDHSEGTYTLSVFRIIGIGVIENHPELDGKMWLINRHKLGYKADSMVLSLIRRIADRIGKKNGILKNYIKK
jgi:hypothetical protein